MKFTNLMIQLFLVRGKARKSLHVRLEAGLSKWIMRLAAYAIGPQAAIWYMVYFPLRRRTQARLLWLHGLLFEQHGSGWADKFILDYLTYKPRLLDYHTLLCKTSPAAASYATLQKALPDLIKGAKHDDRKACLIVALIASGKESLALQAIKYTTFWDNGKVSFSSPLSAIYLRPLSGQNQAKVIDMDRINARSCRRRLLVCDELLPPSVVKMFGNASEKLTIIRYADLYGKIDLAALQEAMPTTEIQIEHARSRVDRFHVRYHELHQATFDIAKTLAPYFKDCGGWAQKILSGYDALEDDITFDLADRLFFKALRMDAVLRAIKDPSFDSVVLCFGNSFEMFRLCLSAPEMFQDERIEACCWSRLPQALIKFEKRLKDIRERVASSTCYPTLVNLRHAAQHKCSSIPYSVQLYLNSSKFSLRAFLAKQHHARDRIAFVGLDSRPYGYDMVRMAVSLQADYEVDAIWTAGQRKKFESFFQLAIEDSTISYVREAKPAFIRHVAPKFFGRAERIANRYLLSSLAAPVGRIMQKYASESSLVCALDCFLSVAPGNLVLRHLWQVRSTMALFHCNQYKMVAFSPARSAHAFQMANVARFMNIPSLTVEPHCLNAAYCRYGTINTDYAAVYSDYYIEEYQNYFGINAERCRAFGSPRIMRPVGYHSEDQREQSRQALGFSPQDPPIIVVPTQPIVPKHILAAWRMILRAARNCGKPMRVLLKTHPEEGEAHATLYEKIIIEEGAEAFAQVVNADIKILLTASHVVLTAYSTTALEAAVLDRNVVIVSQPGVEYPTAYDRILGVPLCETVEETSKALTEALERGLDAASGAREFRDNNPHLFDNSTFSRLNEIVRQVVKNGSMGIRSRADLPSSYFVTAPFREYIV